MTSHTSFVGLRRSLGLQPGGQLAVSKYLVRQALQTSRPHLDNFLKALSQTMVLVPNLADELLSEIFSYLIDDKLLLCFVASQSKRLSELVRPLLAKHVRFITSPPSKSYQLFLRSVTESSLFASMVQDVILAWGQCTSATHDLNNELLERLPRLRSLRIEAHWGDLRWKHEFLKKNPMDFLTKVNLKIRYLSTADVVKYVFLRRLKCLSISYISKPKVPKLPKNRSYGDSNVVCLKLGSRFHMPEDVLNEMLRYPRGLKTLITNLPGWDMPGNYFRPRSELTAPLSPVAVMRALEPTKLSLVDLSLVDENCVWPSHDRSRTDLSDFTAIKKLQISSLCYFLPGNSKRDGIVDLLPASLEEIVVCSLS